jgi:hypothetical protein
MELVHPLLHAQRTVEQPDPPAVPTRVPRPTCGTHTAGYGEYPPAVLTQQGTVSTHLRYSHSRVR